MLYTFLHFVSFVKIFLTKGFQIANNAIILVLENVLTYAYYIFNLSFYVTSSLKTLHHILISFEYLYFTKPNKPY